MGGIFGGGGGSTNVSQTATQQQDINITNSINFDKLGEALVAYSDVYKELTSQQIGLEAAQLGILQAQVKGEQANLAINAANALSTMSVTEKVSAILSVAAVVFILYMLYKRGKK